MRLKYYVGKDKREERRKKRVVRPIEPKTCHSCGDDLNKEGYCPRCTMVLAHYRDVDNARFFALQHARRRTV